MSVQSMTGFGKSEILTETYFVSVEIKSVNNRYLDAQFKIPKHLMILESKMRRVVEKHFSRGSLTCFVQYNAFDEKTTQIQLQENLLEDYLKIIRRINDKLNTPNNLDVSGLLRIPELVQVSNREPDNDLSETRVLPVFTEACGQLQNMRLQEGAQLVADIEQRFASFPQWNQKLRELIPHRQREYSERLRARLRELLGEETNIPEDRVATEIGILAERLDVEEELVRLDAHVSLFIETLSGHAAPGKKLSFILQEMLREVNTLGVKSQFLEIQHQCVTMKENIEIVREQVMNIE